MPTEYSMIDWDSCLKLIYPSPLPQFTGRPVQRNQSEYQDEMVWKWTDARQKPTWAAICYQWATHSIEQGGGIDLSGNAPGDIKRSAQTADHGDWLTIHAANGRTLNRVDYAALFNVVGTAWNSMYANVAVTEFGLPIPGGRMSMAVSASYPYGSSGGAATRALTADNLPSHDHSLLADIIKQQAGLTLFGLNGALGLSPAGKIGASQRTGLTGSANPTAINILPPYIADGNYFIHRGRFKYPVSYS